MTAAVRPADPCTAAAIEECSHDQQFWYPEDGRNFDRSKYMTVFASCDRVLYRILSLVAGNVTVTCDDFKLISKKQRPAVQSDLTRVG